MPTAATDVQPRASLPAEAGPRVLIVLKRPSGLGGMQLRTRRLCGTLGELGVPVSLLTQARPSDGKLPRWTRALATEGVRSRNYLEFCRAVHRRLTAEPRAFDVVHVQGFELELFAALAARGRRDFPLVAQPTVTGPGTRLALMTRLTRMAPGLLQPFWRRADAWIAMSNQAAADIRALGVPLERIRLLPTGVNLDRFHPVAPQERREGRAALEVGDRDFVVMTACRLTPTKRVDLLLRAVLELQHEVPGLRLWIAGEGEERPRLERLAQGSPAVRFFGRMRQPELRATLPLADAFGLVSEREGLSNAMLEAMACGLPVLATDVSGTADVVRHGEEGWIVPAGDRGAVRAGILALADPALRARLGAAALARVRDSYSWDRQVRELVRLYAELAGGTAR